MPHEKRPAIDGSNRQPHSRDNEQSFVNARIQAIAVRKENQGGKYRHVSDGYGEERLRIASGRPGASRQSVRCSQKPKNNHHARPEKRRESEATMNVDTSR